MAPAAFAALALVAACGESAGDVGSSDGGSAPGGGSGGDGGTPVGASDAGFVGGGADAGSVAGSDAGPVVAPESPRSPVPPAPFGALNWRLGLASDTEFAGRHATAVPLPGGRHAVYVGGVDRRLEADASPVPFEYGAGLRILGLRADGAIEWQIVANAQNGGPLAPTESGFRVRLWGEGSTFDVVDGFGVRHEIEHVDRATQLFVEFDADGGFLGSGPEGSDLRAYGRDAPIPVGIDSENLLTTSHFDTIWTRDGGSAGYVCVPDVLTAELADGSRREIRAVPDNSACGVYRADAAGRVLWLRQTSLEYYKNTSTFPSLAESADGAINLVFSRSIFDPKTVTAEVENGRVASVDVGNGVLMRWTSDGNLSWHRSWGWPPEEQNVDVPSAFVAETTGGIVWVVTRTDRGFVIGGDDGRTLPSMGAASHLVLAAFSREGGLLDLAYVQGLSDPTNFGPVHLSGAAGSSLMSVGFERTAGQGDAASVAAIVRLSLGDHEVLPAPVPVQTEAGAPCGVEFGLCDTGSACVAGVCDGCTQDFHCAAGERCNGRQCWPRGSEPVEPGSANWGDECLQSAAGACIRGLVCDPQAHRCAECVNDGDCDFGTCQLGRCTD
ncbi:hypothetical protein L6V77_34615 [Myxococcota bacterium]|nr:hypothetical protein [Myxococcota bacterium]